MLVMTTAVFSQNCITVTSAFFSLETDGTYSLTVNYAGNGNKNLETTVKCGATQLNYYCLDAKDNGQKVYTGIVSPGGISCLSAMFVPHTGACNSAQCGPTQIFPEGGGPLPVKLSAFSAARSKQNVTLTWSTVLEIDTKEFIVERAEGSEFRSVGSIKSKGNSSTKQDYSFTDRNDNAGTTYYRLKNADMNGQFTYSEIKSVKGNVSATDVSVFPNPARPNSKLSIIGVTANSSIQLVDFSGKILKNLSSNTTNSIDLTGVQNGTYLVRIIDKTTNEIVNKKLTVSN